MKRKFLIPSALALAVGSGAALLGACKATDTAGNMSAATAARPDQKSAQPAAAGTTEAHPDGIRRVNAAQLLDMVGRGGVVIYDTRTKASYDQEHIQGALSMPHDEVASRVGEFPRDKTLVFYCT